MGAAPYAIVRSLGGGVSVGSSASASRSIRSIVAATDMEVTSCRWHSSMIRRASKRSGNTTGRRRAWAWSTLYAATWNSGKGNRYTSSSASGLATAVVATAEASDASVTRTPLGRPVEPDVKMIQASPSSWRWAAATLGASGASGGPSVAVCDVGRVPVARVRVEFT